MLRLMSVRAAAPPVSCIRSRVATSTSCMQCGLHARPCASRPGFTWAGPSALAVALRCRLLQCCCTSCSATSRLSNGLPQTVHSLCLASGKPAHQSVASVSNSQPPTGASFPHSSASPCNLVGCQFWLPESAYMYCMFKTANTQHNNVVVALPSALHSR